MLVKIGGWTEKGKRANNEDCFAIDVDHCVAAISDGMGGEPYGEVMSKVAVNAAMGAFVSCGGSPEEAFYDAFEAAFAEVVVTANRIGKDAEHSAATLLMLSWGGDRILRVANAGDSALMATTDDGVALLTHPDRVEGTKNVLSKGIGKRFEWKPTHYSFPCSEGSTFIACTDGVWGLFFGDSAQELEAVPGSLISDAETVPIAALSLAKWCARNGFDNASAIVLETVE